MAYLIIKTIHIIGVITWFAGLFYIFRLYVYHVENQEQILVTNVLDVMEKRLYYAITWPSLIVTTLMGFTMILMNPQILQLGWIKIKLAVLILLYAYHFFAGHTRKEFLKKNYFLTSKQCRLINEVPTVVLLIVIPLAILKPF